VDEWTFTQLLGPEEASRQLRAHWDSWLTQTDLETLAAAGIAHIRIPIGYWAVDISQNEPYVPGQLEFLIRALDWCLELGLKALIDIHGVPGSQNGFDNSGRRGDIHWSDGGSAAGVNYFRTLAVLANLTSILKPYFVSPSNPAGPVSGIELVNEPFLTIDLAFVQSYYENGYSIVRAVENNTGSDPLAGLTVVIHDSFRMNEWAGFMQPPNWQNVYLDTHHYEVFDYGLLQLNESQHLDFLCGTFAKSEAAAAMNLWLLTGEWSLATTDCARWLNGFQRGARWDGTLDRSHPPIGACTGDAGNDFSQFTAEYKQWMRTWAEAQMGVYENADGSSGSGSAGWVS
jgi:glucan 1,3-beta-glucosidase